MGPFGSFESPVTYWEKEKIGGLLDLHDITYNAHLRTPSFRRPLAVCGFASCSILQLGKMGSV